jgi:hypothetical protein
VARLKAKLEAAAVTRAMIVKVRCAPTARLAIVMQARPPLRVKLGAETKARPGCGESQTRMFLADASPVLVTRSR